MKLMVGVRRLGRYFAALVSLLLLVACAPGSAPAPTEIANINPTATNEPRANPTATLAPIATAAPSPYAPRITLSAAQRESFIKLISSDAEAKSRFDSVKRQVDGLMTFTPNPIDKIQMAGKLASDPVMIKSQESMRDMNAMYLLGITFAGTGDSKYGAKAKEFILSWTRVNQPTGNPIDETNLDYLFFAYDLTRATFSSDEIAVADAWLRRLADAEIADRETASSQRSSTAKNNFNSHRMKIVGLIGFLLADQNLIDYAVKGYKQQIADDLNPDGSSFDFIERDALHYHVYTLEPLLVLARVAQMNGAALYSYEAPNGASLPKSIAFLIPYANSTKTHGEFVNSTIKFDRDRAAAGQAGYQAGTLFDPKEASHLLEFEYFFDPAVLPLVIKINNSNTARYPVFQIVLEAVRR